MPAAAVKRLPRLLAFDGRDATPDKAVRTALTGRYETHLTDERLRGKLREIEGQVQDLLCTAARSLVDRIQSRCPDLAHLEVIPDAWAPASARADERCASASVARAVARVSTAVVCCPCRLWPSKPERTLGLVGNLGGPEHGTRAFTN